MKPKASQPPVHVPSASVQIQDAALNAWRVGVIVDLARSEACDRAPVGGAVPSPRVCEHVERIDAILAGAAALLRELHGELVRVDDRLTGRT
ncbi:hypothetical protein [Phenylobacterium sp.]|jgi:hypothetical protein|uniref:hypothetical protein n=1 Tax=Phenylobacterium sp. TaxID=1871053 RepID=UPI002F3F9905